MIRNGRQHGFGSEVIQLGLEVVQTLIQKGAIELLLNCHCNFRLGSAIVKRRTTQVY